MGTEKNLETCTLKPGKQPLKYCGNPANAVCPMYCLQCGMHWIN